MKLRLTRMQRRTGAGTLDAAFAARQEPRKQRTPAKSEDVPLWSRLTHPPADVAELADAADCEGSTPRLIYNFPLECLPRSTQPSSPSSPFSCSDPDVCIANGTYLSTGVLHERKKFIGSCVPTKSRANSRRFNTSCRRSSGKSRA
jgi:hypothetical protein